MKLYQNLNVTGSLTLSGSMTTSGSLSILGSISGSLTLTGSNNILKVNGSGSNLISANGTSGKLFSVDDDLTNSLFSITNISGLPVMQAFADGTVNLGTYNSTITGSTINITSNNYVGFNTANPSEKFDISTGQGVRAGMSLTGDYPYIKFNVTSSNANARNWAFSTTWAEFGDFALLQGTAKDTSPIPSGNTIMYFNKSGNIGINTISPSTYLEVSNNGTSNNAYITARNSGVAGYRSGAIFINQGTGGLSWYLVSTNNSDGDWGGGKFSISTNNATGVYLNGAAATTWTGQSDIRLKDIDSEIEDATNKVMQLRGVRFTWKSDETKKMQVGLIAQEVKEVLPEAVDFDDTNEDYKMGVQYTDIIPLLVNAIKELKAEINELKNK